MESAELRRFEPGCSGHCKPQSLAERLPLQLIASGGVSSLEELRRLKALGLYGAILGKALYTGALSLRGALGEVE